MDFQKLSSFKLIERTLFDISTSSGNWTTKQKYMRRRKNSGKIMKKIIVITGLPGSGKSTYINKTYKDRQGYRIISEDYQANAINDSPVFERSKHYSDLLNTLRETDDIPVISDLRYCSKNEQKSLIKAVHRIYASIEIEWVCLTTKPDECKLNIEKRGRLSKEKEKNLVDEYSPIYSIPEGAKEVPFNRQTATA